MSEKIEIGYRNIGSIGGVEYYHKFLLYTDSNGNQYTISGWTGNDTSSALPYGHMNVELDLPYDQSNPDFPTQNQKQYREPITEGDDLSSVWNDMLSDALSKDDLYPYDPLRQNSNSLADALLRDAGLNAPEDDNLFNPFDHWTPGADKELDKNLVPLDPQSVPMDALEQKLKDWLDGLVGDIGDDVNSLWHAFKNWTPPRRDPLVLDLDGDGIETMGITSTTQVLFDYDNDGVKTGTGWIAGDDGFVVLDRNGNGTIDNGGELFGDQTLVNGVKAKDGFAALSAEDTNKNGKFDAGDTNFTKVRIWQDTNSDGISQASELHTLNELGITSINLTSTTSNTVSNGNVQIAAGTYTKTNGTTGTSGTLNLTEDTGNAGNLNFSQNPFYSEFTDHFTLTDTALALPDMQGSGMVRDLREASTLSSGLTSTLQTMSTTYESRDQMMAQVDTLLAQWAGTSNMATSIQQEAAVNGKTLVYLPTQNSSDFDLYFKMLGYSDTSTVSGFSSLASVTDIQRYNYLLAEQTRITSIISILERFNGETFLTIEPNKVTAGSGTVTATLTSTTTSGSGAVMIDPRVFVGLSSAQVSFLDQSYTTLKQSVYDSLVLQTRFSSYMDAINLTIDETGIHIDDSAMMQMISDRMAADPANALRDMIELRKYAGSTLGALGWNADSALSKALAQTGTYDTTSVFAEYGMIIADGVYTGTEGNDVVWGKQRDDSINAGAGNDTVYGGSGIDDSINAGDGSDTVYGGDGNDTINAGDGSDYIDGGVGNDILNGSYGQDIYIFNRGDGQDTIYDYGSEIDTLKFGAGISESDISIFKNGSDLKLSYGANDLITITNQSNTNNAIEKFTLSDGYFLTSNDLNVIIQSMNAYATDHGISIISLDTVKNNQDLMNIVAAGWHK